MQMNMGFVSLRHGLAILGGFAALAIAAVWLFATPIFAEPDEQAHLDYALTIVDEGLPARAPSSARIVATDTDSTLRYLEDALHYRELRFDNSYRVANAFFSREGRLAIDAGVTTNVVDQKMRRTLPAVAPYYPAGYYVVAAAVYAVSRSVFHLGAIESIYAMRVLGLLALVVTLTAAYRIFLELGFSRRTSALAMTAVGLFPLVSWVSAMIQPDTFTTAGVTFALLCVLRVRRRPDVFSNYLLFALAVALLAFVKVQYAALTLCGLTPALIGVAARSSSYRRAGAVAVAIASGGFALFASFAVLPHVGRQEQHFSVSLLRDPRNWLADLGDIFFEGTAHTTFWSSRDWFDTTFFGSATSLVDVATAIASAVVIVFVAATVVRASVRLARLVPRHWRIALTVALADAPLGLYVVWTLGLVFLDLAVPGHIGLLGRYWLPVFVPLLAIVMKSISRPRFPKRRAAIATSVAVGYLAYAVVAAPFAFAQMHQRFFSPQGPRSTLARRVTVERIWDSRGRTFDTQDIALVRGSRLCFRGVAIDSRYGLIPASVDVNVDGRIAPLRSGIPRTYPANVYNDDALKNIGFEGCVAPESLTVGRHEARLEIIARDGAALHWPPRLHVTVVRASSSRRRRGS